MASISSPWYALSTPPIPYADSCILKPHQLLVLGQSKQVEGAGWPVSLRSPGCGGSRNVLVWKGSM